MKDYWNASLYDNKHSFVSNYGTSLMALLAPKAFEKILDVGCGTGDLAKKLSDSSVDIVGIDCSQNMIEQAMHKYPSLPFIIQDVTEMTYDNEFDAVFSNATLHWVKSPKQALHCIHKSLIENGRFVAEFGGKGNVETIIDEIILQIKAAGYSFPMTKFPWYYPSIGEYSTLMESVGFKVTFAEHFDRPTALVGDDGLKNWISMFCNDMFIGIDDDSKEKIIIQVEQNLKEVLFQDGHWIADYKRIRISGVK